MIYTKEKLEQQRYYYYPDDFDVYDHDKLREAFDELHALEPNTPRELMSLLYQSSELMSILSIDYNYLTYQTIRNTGNLELREKLETFVRDVMEYAEERNVALLKKYYKHPLRNHLNQDYFKMMNVYLESLFNEAIESNADLNTEERRLTNLYRDRVNQLSFDFEGKAYLFKDAPDLLRSPDPLVRAAVWNCRKDAFLTVKAELHETFDRLVKIRHQQTINAGFKHYYSMNNLMGLNGSLSFKQLHDILPTVRKHLNPIIVKIYKQWQKIMKVNTLAPWDCAVSPLASHFQPFENSEELITKAIRILYDMRFEYGLLLNKIWNTGLLDLDAMPQKAPGQFYFGEYRYNSCRVMMSCTGTQDDLTMFFHELGHVLQVTSIMKSPIYTFIMLPLDVREIASQAMVYLSTASWEDYYPDANICKAAIRYQFHDDLLRMNTSLCNNRFEMDVYANPEWTPEQREECYLAYYKEHFPCFKGHDYDEYISAQWLLNFTTYQYPFYDVFTALSLFGVWQIYRNYQKDPDDTVIRFQNFLSKTSEYNIAELYDVLGIKYDLSESSIKRILEYVKSVIK